MVQCGGAKVSGIYIKNIEMPKNCRMCMFSGFGGMRNEVNVCMFNGFHQPKSSPNRMETCPLVAMPGHGRLIDADNLVEIMRRNAEKYGGVGGVMVIAAAECVDVAPTIIPADEERKTGCEKCAWCKLDETGTCRNAEDDE